MSAAAMRLPTTVTVGNVVFGNAAPLSLIAGIYGMNFKHMPELEWQYGYPLVHISDPIAAVPAAMRPKVRTAERMLSDMMGSLWAGASGMRWT